MDERLADAPKELRDALIQSFTVERYDAYEEGIFHDSTGHHTLRCVGLVNKLP